MSSNNKNLPPKKRVFFITSNYSRDSKSFEYTLENNKAMENLKAGEKSEYITTKMYLNDKYTISICSFEIIQPELKDELKDKKKKMFKAKITLKNKKYSFEGWAYFRRKDKNNFIYDFKFGEHTSILFKKTPPPPSINFSKYEQFNLYLDYLKTQKIKSKEEISIDLIQNSQYFVFNEDYQMDFFMSIFKACFTQREILLFLLGFKLEKSILPNDFRYKDYSSLLVLIEKKPQIIIQHCKKEEEKPKLYLKFYTLLFYLRYQYDKPKAAKMIANKELYIYFAKFLPLYPNYFPDLICPEELIDEMFKGDLKLKNIIGIFSYTGSNEKILFLINKYANYIKNSALKDKKKIIM